MGHTEATVDLMRIARLKECGLCCEIMREDGTMMRTPELKEFAVRHGLKMITVADLILSLIHILLFRKFIYTIEHYFLKESSGSNVR